MARILITGISGFVGRHLASHLASRGHRLWGLHRNRARVGLTFAKGIQVSVGDVCDYSKLRGILNEARPEIIYHLASLIDAKDVEDLYMVNTLGTVMIFEALASLNLSPKVLIASSSAVYGASSPGQRLTERAPTKPATHHGVSKLAQEMIAYQYAASQGFPLFVARSFNLVGPGQSPVLACSAFARQIAEAECRGAPDRIFTGDLETQRDFTDVRDAVRAYDLIVARGKPGMLYNVCSGKATSIRHCLTVLLEAARVRLRPAPDASRRQEGDVSIQVGSAARLRRQTGWKPTIPLEQSLQDLLNYWRGRTT